MGGRSGRIKPWHLAVSVMALFVLSAAAVILTHGRNETTSASLKVRKAVLKQAGTTYPRVTNLKDPALQRKVDAAIVRAARRAIPDYDPGTSVVEATSSYRTTLNAKGILSLRFEDYYYPEMAAHGVTGVSSVTLDLCTGRVYRFQALFLPRSGYRALLDRIIKRQIEERRIPLLKPFPGVGPDEDYYLTPKELAIYYQPYVYTPGAFGVLEFKIPYAEIADIIDPAGPIGLLTRGLSSMGASLTPHDR